MWVKVEDLTTAGFDRSAASNLFSKSGIFHINTQYSMGRSKSGSICSRRYCWVPDIIAFYERKLESINDNPKHAQFKDIWEARLTMVKGIK